MLNACLFFFVSSKMTLALASSSGGNTEAEYSAVSSERPLAIFCCLANLQMQYTMAETGERLFKCALLGYRPTACLSIESAY